MELSGLASFQQVYFTYDVGVSLDEIHPQFQN